MYVGLLLAACLVSMGGTVVLLVFGPGIELLLNGDERGVYILPLTAAVIAIIIVCKQNTILRKHAKKNGWKQHG